MDFEISNDFISLMHTILNSTEPSPTVTTIQIIEKGRDVPYISVFNTIVIIKQLNLGTCVPNIIHGQ